MPGINYYKEKISQYPVLPDKEVRSLIALAKKGDIEARNKVVKHNLLFVLKLGLVASYNTGVELDELVSEGNIGLFEAIDHYDEKNGARFLTIAKYYIERAIKTYIRDKRKVVHAPAYKTVTFCDVNEVYHQNHLQPTSYEETDFIDNLLSELTEFQQFIIRRYYGIGVEQRKSFRWIGNERGRSRQITWHHYDKGMKKLKKKLRKELK